MTTNLKTKIEFSNVCGKYFANFNPPLKIECSEIPTLVPEIFAPTTESLRKIMRLFDEYLSTREISYEYKNLTQKEIQEILKK